MLRYPRVILFILLFFFLFPASLHSVEKNTADDPKPLEIINITPAGKDVPPGRQIVFQFNRPVVPVGRMERTSEEIPVKITPDPKGQWRWLNTSSLALMLDDNNQLSPATQYNIMVKPGIEAEDGATIKEAIEHTFVTERPRTRRAHFFKWESPGAPVLRIFFNQPVTKESLENHIHIYLKDNKENPCRVTAEPDPGYKEIPRILPLPGEPAVLITSGKKPEQTEDMSRDRGKNMEARKVWLVSPVDELPLDTPVTFHAEPGLVTPLGPEKGIENRDIQLLHTLPEFEFLGVQCSGYGQDHRPIVIESGDDLSKCNPGRPFHLLFSSPAFYDEVINNITVNPDPPSGINNNDSRGYLQNDFLYRMFYRSGHNFRVNFYDRLDPNKKYKIKSEPGQIIDVFGRTLKEPLDISFSTGRMEPACSYKRTPVILEKDAETDMPFSVTNLDDLSLRYDRITAEGKKTDQYNSVSLPDIKDKELVVPAGTRKMLKGRSGLVNGSVRTGPDTGYYNDPQLFVAEVTPFDVHIKLGHFNTLVWVTDMSTGRPVSDAEVKIFMSSYSSLDTGADVITGAKTDSSGIAILGGNNIIPDQPRQNSRNYLDQIKLFMLVEKDDDIALLTLDHDFNVNIPYIGQDYYRPKAWGSTAQGVYKPGDKIQYKIYVRDMNNETFISPVNKKYNLKVIDPMRQTIFEKTDCTLSEFGTINGELTVPESGPAGWYRFQLSNPDAGNVNRSANYYSRIPLEPMRVLISDFTPAPFDVTTEINGDFFEPGDEITVTAKAMLHDGGPYGDASARVTLLLNYRHPVDFFNLSSRQLTGFIFDIGDNFNKNVLKQLNNRLDRSGRLVMKSDIPDNEYLLGELITESAVRDDRGKYISDSKSVKYAARDYYVGIRGKNRSFQEKEPASVEFIVLDKKGEPVAGIPINVKIEFEEVTVIREKGRGNTTIRKHMRNWRSQESRTIESGEEPLLFAFTPEESGNYRITGIIKDTKGRMHSSRMQISVFKDAWWQNNRDTYNSLKIIPEETAYKVGDTAKYRVKNPFPGAKALITVERYGILRQWVQDFDTEEPVIEFKIEKDFIPGYHLSAAVMSSRTAPAPENKKEYTGRPDFRIGYIKTEVNDYTKKLDIGIKSEKEIYKPGEKVKIDLEVSSKTGNKKEPVELAVAVLNEEVLSLISQGKDYFDPYKGFYNNIDFNVRNFNLLIQMMNQPNLDVSSSLFMTAFEADKSTEEFMLEEITVTAEKREAELQKVELKGPQRTLYGRGSIDGIVPEETAKIDIRSILKLLTYWNPSIITETGGKTSFEFEAPENLTGWRILAMAVTPTDQMGLGDEKIAVTRPTEIRPVMPNQVTEGDSFKAGFSIMNRAEETRSLTMTITAEGAVATDSEHTGQITETVTAEPYKRNTIWLPLKAKGSGIIRFTVSGGDSFDRDGLTHEIEVHKMASLETASTYGTADGESVTEQLHIPDGIRDDVGKIFVNFSPTVIGQVEGAFEYIRDYPYMCWEQVLTKGVMASHYISLKKYMPDDFKWENAESLIQSTLKNAASFQAPNGGMTYYISENRYVSPYLSAYTSLAFTWLKERGLNIPQEVMDNLNLYLERMIESEAGNVPGFYTPGMASTVRAVALAALSRQNKITIGDIRRYYSHVKEMDLFGKAHFLMAAADTPGTDKICRDVFDMILSHSAQSGGKFIFSESFDDGYSRILTSALRSNAALLSSFIAYGKTEEGNKLIGDIPFKIVRYITQTRKQSGRWENTQENIFCMNALVEYSRAYENTKPDMKITAMLGKEILGKASFEDVRDEPVESKRLIRKGDPGRKTSVTIRKKGKGRFYYNVGLKYAPDKLNTGSINAGIDIKREYSVERNGEWILLKSPMEIKRGELVRVDLFVSIPAARNFVVVDDPVPGGLEPVNKDLATSSLVDADKGKFKAAGGSWWFHYGNWSYYGMSRWSFYHRELRHHAARFYSEYLSAGNYHLSYTAQAIASGEFTVMPAHAEEMYDPDVYGKSGAGILKVGMENN